MSHARESVDREPGDKESFDNYLDHTDELEKKYSISLNTNNRKVIYKAVIDALKEKKRNDYWDCIKKEKKSIGEYPFKSRNNTSKKFKAMSLKEKVKHTQRKIRNLRTKYKKEIDIYNKKTARMYKKCNKGHQI